MNERAVDLLTKDMGTRTRGMLDGPAVHAADPRVAAFALSYLDAFGWLKQELTAWQDISLLDIKLALGDLQASLGLKKTKSLTVQTVRAMEAPRCGCPDKLRPHHACHRELDKRRKALLPKWKKAGLTYHIKDTPKGIDPFRYDLSVKVGFAFWLARVEGLKSVSWAAAEQDADVVFSTGRGKQSNFDGPGGTLAWASLPDGSDRQLGVKLDDDERWNTNPTDRGFFVDAVVCHEIGHVLGLTHSRYASALMAPQYNPLVSVPQELDDVPRIQARYGASKARAFDLKVRVPLQDALAAIEAAGYKVSRG